MLSVEKLQPLIEVDELVEVYLEPNQITADLLAILNIQRAGIYQIELEVPEGYEIRTVQGRDAAGAVRCESHGGPSHKGRQQGTIASHEVSLLNDYRKLRCITA